MAGDWIKMRVNLWTHPKVMTLALRLSVTRAQVIGSLHGVWGVADQHARGDGVVEMAPDSLDALVELPGFCKALASVGWLVIDGDRLQFPDYQEHNGATAKVRAQTARRNTRMRARDASVTPGRHATVTREEKRREEKRKSQTPTESGSPAAEPPESPRDELFDAVAEVGHADPKIHGARIGRVCSALKKADPAYTPDEVRRLPDAVLQHGLNFTWTVEAVLKHIRFVRDEPKAGAPQSGFLEFQKHVQFSGPKEFLARRREPSKRYVPGPDEAELCEPDGPAG